MFESQKNSKDQNKSKNAKVNRATVLTFVGLILAVGVIVIAAVAANRSKKQEEPPVSNPPSNTQNNENKNDPPADLPNDTPNPDNKPEDKPTTPDNNDEQVENTLPSFILPVSGTLTAKHDPTLQVFSDTMKDYRVHLGIDISTDESAPVYSAADGVVSKIWKDTLMGYCIAIEHSGDCFTIYKNLAETIPEGIAEGTKVRAGQLIASVGESAMVEVAEEPHLHFEMTVGSLGVDPLEYFDESALASLSLDASYEE